MGTQMQDEANAAHPNQKTTTVAEFALISILTVRIVYDLGTGFEDIIIFHFPVLGKLDYPVGMYAA
jgi:hypothetical protein